MGDICRAFSLYIINIIYQTEPRFAIGPGPFYCIKKCENSAKNMLWFQNIYFKRWLGHKNIDAILGLPIWVCHLEILERNWTFQIFFLFFWANFNFWFKRQSCFGNKAYICWEKSNWVEKRQIGSKKDKLGQKTKIGSRKSNLVEKLKLARKTRIASKNSNWLKLGRKTQIGSKKSNWLEKLKLALETQIGSKNSNFLEKFELAAKTQIDKKIKNKSSFEKPKLARKT